jgi:hypothetical protein
MLQFVTDEEPLVNPVNPGTGTVELSNSGQPAGRQHEK